MFWSATNPKFVFPAFKYALGTNEITGYNDNNIALSFVTQDVTALTNKNYWSRDCASPFLRYSAFYYVPDYAIQFADTYVNSVFDASVNSVSEESGAYTYQEMTHLPPEHYLFTPGLKGANHYISASPMLKDLDYDVYAFYNVKGSKGSKGTKGTSTLSRKAAYLTKEYRLSGVYNSDLYKELGIPEDYVIEDISYLNGNSVEFKDRDDLVVKRVQDYVKIKHSIDIKGLKSKKGSKGVKGIKGYKGKKGFVDTQNDVYYSGRILEFGARGIILSYTDDDHRDGNMIPMAYYEFHNPIYSNQDYIKINWNTNGFIEVQ